MPNTRVRDWFKLPKVPEELSTPTHTETPQGACSGEQGWAGPVLHLRLLSKPLVAELPVTNTTTVLKFKMFTSNAFPIPSLFYNHSRIYCEKHFDSLSALFCSKPLKVSLLYKKSKVQSFKGPGILL